MLYTVWYKKPGRIFWHKIKDVEGDAVVESQKGYPVPVRALYLVNKTRLEIPMDCVIKFSKERYYGIQTDLEREAAKQIKTK